MWNAVFEMCDIFCKTAIMLNGYMVGLTIIRKKKCMGFLKNVRCLLENVENQELRNI